jgi:eukaryotic-like serine/threonine-protein kinase
LHAWGHLLSPVVPKQFGARLFSTCAKLRKFYVRHLPVRALLWKNNAGRWRGCAERRFAGSSMAHFGEQWTGACLAGEYTLDRYIAAAPGDAAEGAFFAATHDSGEPVLLELIPRSASAQDRLSLWRRTAHLHHPNLLRLLDCGLGQPAPGAEECPYAVFEWPDDRLSPALDQGPLSEQEARELLIAMLDALRYLHAQGLVHGSVDASNVVAVGNAIKLSTDNLREPDSGRFSYACDIGELGALLHRVLTGHEFDGADALSGPFATIIRNTAGAEPADRWRIPEILAALPPAPVVEEPLIQAPVEPVAPLPVELVPPPPAEALSPQPPVEAQSAPPLLAAPPVRRPQPTPVRLPFWAWPVSLAAIGACIVWVLHSPAPKARPKPAASVYSPVSTRAKPAATEARTEPVESTAPPERAVWRVIAYTYTAWRDAEKQALAINHKWPELKAEVFAPKGANHPPYVVALGGRMNREEAAGVLQKARSHGLPRDIYMQNFSD